MKIQQSALLIALISILIFAIIGLVLIQVFTPATVSDTTDTIDTTDVQDTPADTIDQEPTDTADTTDTEETNNTSHITVDVEEGGCESSLITCGCHAKGTSPESQGLLGGINCYGIYGLTGCEEINGVCFPIYENPGLEVDKSVYAMSEKVYITFKPQKGAYTSSENCRAENLIVSRYVNGTWTQLQIEELAHLMGACVINPAPVTKVEKDTWNLGHWIEEPQMQNGEIVMGMREVNVGPGHYKVGWKYCESYNKCDHGDRKIATAEFQVIA